jgi:hypothetical protein
MKQDAMKGVFVEKKAPHKENVVSCARLWYGNVAVYKTLYFQEMGTSKVCM